MQHQQSKKRESIFHKLSKMLLLPALLLPCPDVASASDSIDSGQNQITVSTDIQSSVDEVWTILLDFKNYSSWNKWYLLEGEAKENANIRAYSESGQHLDLKITKIAENTICWVDVSWFTYLGLGGWRCRSVEPNPDGNGIKLINHFEYSGPFRYFLKLKTKQAVLEGMVLENRSLKTFVEKIR